MIYTRLRFFTSVYWDASRSVYRRTSTGQSVETPGPDDIPMTQDEQPVSPAMVHLLDSGFIIHSRRQLRSYFKWQRATNYLVVVACFLGMFWAIFDATRRYWIGDVRWYTFGLVGVFAVLAAIYLAQARNPVVHDGSGHWVNLRNGSCNLNGGCVILKDAVDKPIKSPYVVDAGDVEDTPVLEEGSISDD